MIVREKAPRYIALTWQEFCAHIQHNGGWMPRDGVVMGHRCEQNTTKTGYFVYETDGSSCVMNEDSVLLFYGDNNEYVYTKSRQNPEEPFIAMAEVLLYDKPRDYAPNELVRLQHYACPKCGILQIDTSDV